MDAPIIEQHIIHFQISLFARFLLFKFDESVLHGIAAHFVSNDFARFDFAEATEDDL